MFAIHLPIEHRQGDEEVSRDLTSAEAKGSKLVVVCEDIVELYVRADLVVEEGIGTFVDVADGGLTARGEGALGNVVGLDLEVADGFLVKLKELGLDEGHCRGGRVVGIDLKEWGEAELLGCRRVGEEKSRRVGGWR